MAMGAGYSSKGLKIFHNIYGKNNYQEMLDQLKLACLKLDKKYSSALLYCALTGLRPAEACTSLRLLKERKGEYLTNDKKILENFRFPKIFMRRTKNAYISLTFEKLFEITESLAPLSYNSLRLALRRHNLKLNISICRKIFDTFLRSEGIEQALIDLLQGRISKSVFVRHYYRPDPSKFDEIRDKPVLSIIHKITDPIL
jgi:intergrase/recombinase